jgi:hypothetical protein
MGGFLQVASKTLLHMLNLVDETYVGDSERVVRLVSAYSCPYRSEMQQHEERKKETL